MAFSSSDSAFRITPACAGKRDDFGADVSLASGSPPRVRGKGPEFVAVVLLAGITPAYAGKSAVKSLLCHRVGDHPRVCGEKRSGKWPRHRWQGSPPRMRGKELLVVPPAGNFGITPAYAGKSSLQTCGKPRNGDHPRVCGEKSSSPGMSSTRGGSPPRMRGKDDAATDRIIAAGITPAYAGKRNAS